MVESNEGFEELPSNAGPVPSELHSVYEGGPFKSCSLCSKGLFDGGLYEIQKVFRGLEVIFEMAICRACGESACQEFSTESIDALKGFLLSNFQPLSAGESCGGGTSQCQTSHCQFCAFPAPLLRGYSLIGACKNNELILPPLVLCDSCGENMQARLSQKTRDAQEGFLRDHFPGVPENLDFSPTLSEFLG